MLSSMEKATSIKDIFARMDTIFVVIDECDETIKLLEQSIATITHYIENRQFKTFRVP